MRPGRRGGCHPLRSSGPSVSSRAPRPRAGAAGRTGRGRRSAGRERRSSDRGGNVLDRRPRPFADRREAAPRARSRRSRSSRARAADVRAHPGNGRRGRASHPRGEPGPASPRPRRRPRGGRPRGAAADRAQPRARPRGTRGPGERRKRASRRLRRSAGSRGVGPACYAGAPGGGRPRAARRSEGGGGEGEGAPERCVRADRAGRRGNRDERPLRSSSRAVRVRVRREELPASPGTGAGARCGRPAGRAARTVLRPRYAGRSRTLPAPPREASWGTRSLPAGPRPKKRKRG